MTKAVGERCDTGGWHHVVDDPGQHPVGDGEGVHPRAPPPGLIERGTCISCSGLEGRSGFAHSVRIQREDPEPGLRIHAGGFAHSMRIQREDPA